MTPNRPYLLNAFYHWILDNELTPYIVVHADLSGVQVPAQVVTDGQVVLNIAPSAVQSFLMNGDSVSFSARFGGVPYEIYIPIYAISAIYAKENGAGTMFPEDEYADYDDSKGISSDYLATPEPEITEVTSKEKPKDNKKDKKKGSHLSIVK